MLNTVMNNFFYWYSLEGVVRMKQLPLSGPKKSFCVETDELLRAKDDLLSEGGQSFSLTEQD